MGLRSFKASVGVDSSLQKADRCVQHIIMSFQSKFLFPECLLLVCSNISLCDTPLCLAIAWFFFLLDCVLNMGEVTMDMCLAVCKHVPIHEAWGPGLTHWVRSGGKS